MFLPCINKFPTSSAEIVDIWSINNIGLFILFFKSSNIRLREPISNNTIKPFFILSPSRYLDICFDTSAIVASIGISIAVNIFLPNIRLHTFAILLAVAYPCAIIVALTWLNFILIIVDLINIIIMIVSTLLRYISNLFVINVDILLIIEYSL